MSSHNTYMDFLWSSGGNNIMPGEWDWMKDYPNLFPWKIDRPTQDQDSGGDHTGTLDWPTPTPAPAPTTGNSGAEGMVNKISPNLIWALVGLVAVIVLVKGK